MHDTEQNNLIKAFSALCAGTTSDDRSLVADWLDALIARNLVEMIDCSADKLAIVQQRLKVYRALSAAISDGNSTGYLI
jgi:hypothetical protein